MGTLADQARLLLAARDERKRLRGPAPLQYAIADSIGMLDVARWRHLTAGGSFFLTPEYLQGMERALPANVSPRYAMLFRQGDEGPEALAAVYMQIADIRLAQVRPEKPRPKPLAKLAEQANQRVLACGNLLTYGQHGVAMAPGADAALVWHGVAEALYRVSRAEKLVAKTHFTMIKDLHGPHEQGAQHLLKLSYRRVETEPNMVLQLDAKWKRYEDYLAGLTSKYRTNVRKAVLQPLDEAGCRVERLADLAPHQDRLFALYKNVQVNASFRPFELRPGYFAALQRAAGERFRCSVVRKDDALLGFLISVGDGDTSVAYHIGFDREAAAGGLPLYLRLLHTGIEHAIEMGCARVSYGRTALEPKAALGAKPEPFTVLCRHRQPVLNKLIKGLLTGLEHDEPPDRNPFKQAA